MSDRKLPEQPTAAEAVTFLGYVPLRWPTLAAATTNVPVNGFDLDLEEETDEA